MREGREYRCPECGTTSPVGVSCTSCKVPMLDENGNPPLKPMPRMPSWVVSFWTLAGAASTFLGYYVVQMVIPGPGAWKTLTAGLVLLGAGGLGILLGVTRPRRLLRRQQAKRRARATALLRATPPAVPIGKTGDGVVRIHGRVKVLRPVHAPRSGEPVAAFETDDEREGGRFAVVDESGVAILDDDCFELWEPGTAVGTAGRCGGHLADGATVELVGPAKRGPAADVAGLIADPHYREAAQALVFDGKPGSPVLVLLSPSSSRPA